MLPSHARKRQPPPPPSARDIEQSNATARAMLGGALSQHAWMQPGASSAAASVSASPLVARRFRPLHRRPSGPHNEVAPTPPAGSAPMPPAAPAPSGRPLDDPSPRPPNPVPTAPPPQDHGSLPSPAPSEDNPSKSPRPPSITPAASTLATSPPHARHMPLASLPAPHCASPLAANVARNPAPHQALAGPLYSSPFSGPHAWPSHPNTPNAAPAPGPQPCTANHRCQSASDSGPSVQASDPGSVWYTFSPAACLPRLSDFVASHVHVMNESDMERLGLLHDAIIQKDWLFVLLSNLSSAYLVDENSLASYSPPLSREGFALVNSLLMHNGAPLSRDCAIFLANFPAPLTQIRAHLGDGIFLGAITEIDACFRNLTADWERVVRSCAQHKTLPLADDFLRLLQMRSMVFQRAAFRSLVLRTWGADRGEHIETAMREFMKDQQRGNSVLSSRSQYAVYHNLYNQHLHTSPNANSPPVFNPVPRVQSQVHQINVAQRQAQLQAQLQAQCRSQQQQASLRPQPFWTPSQNQLHHQQPRVFPSQQNQPFHIPRTNQHAMFNFPVPSPNQSPNLNMGLNYPNSSLAPNPPQSSRPRFFPAEDAIPMQPANPTPLLSALHQAHLRSPSLRPREPCSNRFFRRSAGFALPPQRLTTNPVQKFQFELSHEQLQRLLTPGPGTDGSPPSASFGEPTINLRLRCCSIAKDGELPRESEWALLDGFWPAQSYFSLNGTILETRRKLHHGKYLPIDLTSYLEAVNTLTVNVLRTSTDRTPFNYAIAVEIVRFSTRKTIKQDCLSTRVVPSKDILRSIKSSLACSEEDDDDLAIVQSNVTIHLFEPFSGAKIFDIPTRGKNCKHREAFDLDVFLSTRPVVPNSAVSKVDVWRCPYCRLDCRPESLIVDGFLLEVRQELAAKNLLKTRSIVVESDGSWIAKPEPQDDASDIEEHEMAAEATRANSISSRRISVVTLDD